MYGNSPAPTAVASAGPAPATTAIDNAAYLSTFPNVGAAAPVTMASASTPGTPSRTPVFRSLFQVGDQSQPVSSTVRALWGNSSSLTSVASADSAGQTPNDRAARPFDLFSDRSGTFSG